MLVKWWRTNLMSFGRGKYANFVPTPRSSSTKMDIEKKKKQVCKFDSTRLTFGTLWPTFSALLLSHRVGFFSPLSKLPIYIYILSATKRNALWCPPQNKHIKSRFSLIFFLSRHPFSFHFFVSAAINFRYAAQCFPCIHTVRPHQRSQESSASG